MQHNALETLFRSTKITGRSTAHRLPIHHYVLRPLALDLKQELVARVDVCNGVANRRSAGAAAIAGIIISQHIDAQLF